MSAPTPGQAALSRWHDTDGIEVDAARLTPDNLDELWQEFESKPHYDADLNVDGLTLYTDTGRSVVLFGAWACREVGDGLPFALGDAEFRPRFAPAEQAAPVSPDLKCKVCDDGGVLTVPDSDGESASEQACPDPVHRDDSVQAITGYAADDLGDDSDDFEDAVQADLDAYDEDDL